MNDAEIRAQLRAHSEEGKFGTPDGHVLVMPDVLEAHGIDAGEVQRWIEEDPSRGQVDVERLRHRGSGPGYGHIQQTARFYVRREALGD